MQRSAAAAAAAVGPSGPGAEGEGRRIRDGKAAACRASGGRWRASCRLHDDPARCHPISADDARRALTGDRRFFRACEFCRPDARLEIR
ncbi:DUF6233 domain-containing protein [Streptomyces sp900105245]|uniref:DUF6233 domain-containing protein n=1 Tax=Streptomyces sp. 900105245 TaxID=3154379 RepID=A0ABV1UKN2_9ACTN